MTQTAPTVTENAQRQKPARMEDVAKLAGVHSRTVADVLKGTGRVAPATREKVLGIAKSLNYVPNAAARALVTGRTGKVAILSGPLSDHFFSNAVQMLEDHLVGNGYEMMMLHTHREIGELMNATKASLVDGVIMLSINPLKEAFLRQCTLQQPCVLISTSKPDFVDHVLLDLRPAVGEALQLMLKAGRQRIAFLANDRSEEHRGMRMGAYLDGIHEAGRTPEIVDVNTHLSPGERVQALSRYFAEKGCPDAMICQNDETAIYTYRAVSGLGRRVPEDVLLVGCDGLPYMEFFDTPLSTISLPLNEICATAWQMLQARIAIPGGAIQEEVLQGRLVIRGSLLCPALAPISEL